MNKLIGNYCKNWRIDKLNYTHLSDFCRAFHLEYKTMWAFEHGKGQNTKYPFIYYNVTPLSLKDEFARGYFECQ